VTYPLKQVHSELNDDLRELASLYTLGALPEEETAAYEAHLNQGCQVCRDEVASFREMTGAIALTADPLAPRRELRQRLMKTISMALQPPAGHAPGVLYDKDGVLIARPQEMNWQPGRIPGLFLKVLFDDTQRGYTTALVRMTAGTRYPSHRHAGAEELFLLEGDLSVDELSMKPGDYCRGEAGSIHGEIYTNAGCLFMVSSSNHDETLT
jgi:anti-sigma factor ChrR (cupin superfamily)